MIPKPTPQTATRNTRSQSPPCRTQRAPVSQMHAAIPSRSISPYIRIDSGPTCRMPELGEGMLSSIRRILPSRASRCAACVARRRGEPSAPGSEKDLERELLGAAVANQVGRRMKVDVMPFRKGRGCGRVVTRALELVGPPALDLAQFVVVNKLCRSHVLGPPLSIYYYDTVTQLVRAPTSDRTDLTEALHRRTPVLRVISPARRERVRRKGGARKGVPPWRGSR